MEEIGLRVKASTGEFLPAFEYEISKVVAGVKVAKSCVQVNFVPEVEEGEVKVNPAEHSEFT